MISSGKFHDKKILLADKDHKNKNDRTWCFWETGEGFFEEIVFRRWEKLWFHGPGYSNLFETAPYRYKMIRAIDFYQYCLNLVSKAPNVDVKYGQITAVESNGGSASLLINGIRHTA